MLVGAIIGKSAVFGRSVIGYRTTPPLPLSSAPADRTFIAGRMTGTVVRKAPEEAVNYAISWASELNSDLIAQSLWSAFPYGLTIEGQSIDPTQTISAVLLEGGAVGQVYTVRNTIITAAGMEMSRALRVLVGDFNYL